MDEESFGRRHDCVLVLTDFGSRVLDVVISMKGKSCQEPVRNRLFEFWSSLGAGSDFETEFSGRCGRPCFIAEGRASIDAATNRREFSVCLR